VRNRFLIIAALAATSACTAPAPTSAPAEKMPDIAPANFSSPVEPAPDLPPVQYGRFDPALIEKAKAELGKEPKIMDLVFIEDNEVEWTVAVKDDGTPRHGYAGYICSTLKSLGVSDDKIDVRIVDAAKRAEFGDDYRSYNLGAIRCKDRKHIQ
jgi:hypothetical protein